MNLLVVGGGGREHAIIKKVKENPAVETVYALPETAALLPTRCASRRSGPRISRHCGFCQGPRRGLRRSGARTIPWPWAVWTD
ncbi:MAG: hypothetical protein V8R75_16105 [Oscillospiraceae bacterium]